MGQLLRHVAEKTTSMSREDMQPFAARRPANACISHFVLSYQEHDNRNIDWKIHLWADTSHLTGDAAPAETNYDNTNK